MINFLELIKPGALEAWRKHNIRSSVTMAQAIIESAWGDSAPGNNLFGMKWYDGCGYDVQYLDTQEYIQGQYVTMKEPFRKYNSFTDSIYDHTQLLLIDRYIPVRQAESYQEAARALQTCGYATDPAYANALIRIIEQYGLNYYDGGMFKVYGDYEKIAEWARADVQELYERGIMKGDDKGNFNPKEPITREQAASLIMRALRSIGK